MPEVGYCRDCKWWRASATQLWGDCLMMVHHYAGNTITAANFPTHAVAAVRNTPLSSLALRVVLETWPDFGCIQFQPKPQEERP